MQLEMSKRKLTKIVPVNLSCVCVVSNSAMVLHQASHTQGKGFLLFSFNCPSPPLIPPEKTCFPTVDFSNFKKIILQKR